MVQLNQCKNFAATLMVLQTFWLFIYLLVSFELISSINWSTKTCGIAQYYTHHRIEQNLQHSVRFATTEKIKYIQLTIIRIANSI